MCKHDDWMRFYVIWPVRRRVTEAQIRTWFEDAYENGELDQGLAYEAAELDMVQLMARALHDAGLITLGVLQ